MRLLSRGRSRRPRAKTIRPAERYLTLGAEEARRLGCNFVGTEHVLHVLLHDRAGAIASVLARLAVDPAAVESSLASSWPAADPTRAKIDPEALATLGIDLEVVRTQLEQTFGRGALERTRASCLGIAPQLKLALAHALDYAGDQPLGDEHVLLGMLSVPDSAAARVLARFGVSVDDAQATLAAAPR